MDRAVDAPPAGPSRLRALMPSIAWVSAAVLLAWVVNIAWWALLSPEARSAGESETIVIQPGTAEAIASGNGLAFLPSAYFVPSGGTLFVQNLDSVEHRIGANVIPPGGTAELQSADGVYSCTIHPSGYIGISLAARPPFISTLGLALLLGLPLGVLLAVAVAIVGRLDDGSGDVRGTPVSL